MLVGKNLLLPNLRCKGKKRKKEAAAHEGILFTQPHNILELQSQKEMGKSVLWTSAYVQIRLTDNYFNHASYVIQQFFFCLLKNIESLIHQKDGR